MNEIQRIIGDLQKQRDAIERAIAALSAVTGIGTSPSAQQPQTKQGARKRRRMSAEGRARIAEATRRRWAEWRAAQAGKATKKAAGTKTAAKKSS